MKEGTLLVIYDVVGKDKEQLKKQVKFVRAYLSKCNGVSWNKKKKTHQKCEEKNGKNLYVFRLIVLY